MIANRKAGQEQDKDKDLLFFEGFRVRDMKLMLFTLELIAKAIRTTCTILRYLQIIGNRITMSGFKTFRRVQWTKAAWMHFTIRIA